MTESEPREDLVVFVDDEEELRRAAAQSLALADLTPLCFASPSEALAKLGRTFPGVLITDIRMPEMDGVELMRRCLEIDPEFPVILVTGHGDVELAVACMRDGAYDFVEKPFGADRLVDSARRALEKRRLTLENRLLRAEVGRRDAIEARLTGRSAVAIALRQKLRAVAATETDVLILGPTGAGKEVVARALHRASARRDGPFLHLNCAALPEDLVESELFGHEAGAFAGAMRARCGKFEYARGGVVFLDEIDSLTTQMQAKLLHAIQNRSITRLGSNEPIELDLRFFASSKKNLEQEAAEGRFRSDLLYRLNVVTLQVPSLEERREDVPLLFQQLLQEAGARYKRVPPEAPGALLASLAARRWPGNVRELRNLAERYLLGLDPEISAAETSGSLLAERLAEYEKGLIAAAIDANGGSLKATYESLGISRKALYEKMQRHGLSRRDFVEKD